MSALDRQEAVAAAILAALAADPALAALVGARLYDAPPGRADTPQVVLRAVSAADVSTADTEAQRLVFDLDVWDRYALGADLSRPRAVMGHLRRILHMQRLVPEGCDLLVLRCTATTGPSRDPDGIALHGVVTVTALAGHETTL